MDPLADDNNCIALGSKVKVPAGAFNFTFAPSRGPGGQNVNKLATKATVSIDIIDLEKVISKSAIARLKLYARSYLNDNRLIISSSKHRSQLANRKECINKLARLVTKSLQAPKRRKKTRPTAASIKKRLEQKKKRGQRKQARKINRNPPGQ